MEHPFFFPKDDANLFGILHSSDELTANRAVILCHPFGEEKLWSHRVFVNFAREAVKHNIAVLRFDFMGHGDSSGQSEDCTLDSYIADLDSACAALRSRLPELRHFSLLGLRLGATLASLYAEKNGDINQLILWEPIIDGRRYMQELLRINLSTQLATNGSILHDRNCLVEQMQSGLHVNVDGYLISNRFFQECSDTDLSSRTIHKNAGATLVTQIAPNLSQKDRPDLVSLSNCYNSGTFHKVQEPPFWREIKPFCSRADNLITDTIAWMEIKSVQ